MSAETARTTGHAGNVVSIMEKRPHLAGPAFCIECGHKWVSVRPIGTVVMDCPGCGGQKGVRTAMVEKSGELHWHCNCGGGVFLITPDSTYCPNCGLDQTFPKGMGLNG